MSSPLAALRRWLAARDLRLLAIVAVVGLLLWGFVALADEVGELDTLDVDRAILLAFRTDHGATPVGPAWVQRTMTDLSALGSGAVAGLLVVLVGGFLLLDHRPRHALLVLICALGTWGGMSVLKEAFHRTRPSVVVPLIKETGLSFPSGHSMISAALYLTLAELVAQNLPRRRLRVYVVAVGVLLAMLVGTTRVYLGVHYPSDVLAGWSIGAAWALVLGIIGRRLQEKGVVEPAPEPDVSRDQVARAPAG